MAKKKLKLSPAGILFLIATLVLIIALVAVIIVLGKSCSESGNDTKGSAQANTSELATFVPESSPSSESETSPSSESSSQQSSEQENEPVATENIEGLTPIGQDPSPDPNSISIAPTPASSGTASPSATATIYTSPTRAQKNNAKDGYVSKDKVNLRKGPGTNYGVVKSDIPKNTSVTLYEQQGDWWFLKCGSNYGYIRKDMVALGKAPSTPAPDKNSGTYTGTITSSSVAALRKGAGKSYTCITEIKKGETVTVYYKTKDDSGKYWYYVKYGSKSGYVSASLVSTSKDVPIK